MGKEKQTPPAKNWFFTWNNYTKEDLDKMLEFLNSDKVTKYAMQEELGESGTPHLQGQFVLKGKARFTEFKMPKCHFEKTRDEQRAAQYCLKDASKNGERWVKGYVVKRKCNNICTTLWQDWHKSFMPYIEQDPNDRTIYWIWSENGGIGKQSFINHILRTRPDLESIVVGGRQQDMAQGIAGLSSPWIIFINLEMEAKEICWRGLEMIKDGTFFSPKYESKMVQLEFSPHIVVMANLPPSKDLNKRIVTFKVDNGTLDPWDETNQEFLEWVIKDDPMIK